MRCICDQYPHHHECPGSHQEQDTHNPDINAPTERVLSPAPDGVVDWKKIGELLDLE